MTLPDFGYSRLCLTRSQRLLNYLAFQSFDVERIRGRLFKRRVVRTKFNIYVFILVCHFSTICFSSQKDFQIVLSFQSFDFQRI